MKKMILFLAVFFIGASMGMAQANVTFAWDYGTPMPSGFEMRLATTAGGTPTITFDCGPSPTKTCTVLAIPAGSYFAHCRAYQIGVPATLKAYSDASNEVAFTVPTKPVAPTNGRITATQIAVLIDVPDDSIAKIALSFDKKP